MDKLRPVRATVEFAIAWWQEDPGESEHLIGTLCAELREHLAPAMRLVLRADYELSHITVVAIPVRMWADAPVQITLQAPSDSPGYGDRARRSEVARAVHNAIAMIQRENESPHWPNYQLRVTSPQVTIITTCADGDAVGESGFSVEARLSR